MIDMTMKAVVARHCRSVVFACNGNKKAACRVLGISPHTLNGHLRHPSIAPLAPIPDGPHVETHEQQLLRLQVVLSNVPVEVLNGELLSAERRGAAEYARNLKLSLDETIKDAPPIEVS